MKKFYLSVLIVLIAITGSLIPDRVDAAQSAKITKSEGNISDLKEVEVFFDSVFSFDRYEWFIQISKDEDIWALMQGEEGRTLVLSMAKVLSLSDKEVTVKGRAWYGDLYMESEPLTVYINNKDYQDHTPSLTEEDVFKSVESDELVIDDTHIEEAKKAEQAVNEVQTPAFAPTPVSLMAVNPANNPLNVNPLEVAGDEATINDGTLEDEPVQDGVPQNASSGEGDVLILGDDDVQKLGDDEAETYNVVVNFVFVDGTIAHEPIVATLEAGQNYSYTVNIEQLTGYESYVGNDAAPSTSFNINITNIQQNHNYTVTYRPSIVNYTVEYYWQDTITNTYSLHEFETLSGYTGDIIDEVDKQYNGMYALIYDRPIIAADGSTIVRVYYDRYNYLMSFNLNGGKGVDSIYARYGAAINVRTPNRIGWEFAGWQPEVPTSIPVGGGTYTAQWTPLQTTVTVVYFGEEIGPEEKYSVIGTTTESALSGSTVSDADYQADFLNSYTENQNFVYNSSKTATYTVEGDGSTIVNVYYSRRTATYTFYDGGTTVAVLTGKVGSTFESYGVSWPEGNYSYSSSQYATTTMTMMNGWVLDDAYPDIYNVEFNKRDAGTGRTILFYKQKADGSYSVADTSAYDNIVTTSTNSTFTITNKYTGYEAVDYRCNTNNSRTAWFFADDTEYNGTEFYSTTNGLTGTQYGVVNGEIVQLSQGAWRKPDNSIYTGDYVYQTTTATSGNLYGVVGNEIVELTYGYYYPATGAIYKGTYYYTQSTANNNNTYGVVDGEVSRLYRSNGYTYTLDLFTNASKTDYYWNGNGFGSNTIYNVDGVYYRTRNYDWWSGEYEYSNECTPYSRTRVNGNHYYPYSQLENGGALTEYTGTRYTRSSTVPTSAYSYGFVDGDIRQIARGAIAGNARYTGTRYTRREAIPVTTTGTWYGFDDGAMIQLTADDNGFYARGQLYEDQRYLRTTSPTSGTTYYVLRNGVMVPVTSRTVTDNWESWTPVTPGSTQITGTNRTMCQIRYERVKYNLRFFNYDDYDASHGALVAFGSSLSTYDYTPIYPADLPIGAYHFDGWYSNSNLSGDPFNFSTTMPSNDLTLFAKYSPNTFPVNVYEKPTDIQNGVPPISVENVPYGSLATPPPDPVSPAGYTFVGWFYTNEYGNEVPFSFATSEIEDGMNIYAKWTSEVLVNYSIHFEDEEGNQVADPIESSAIEGTSKIFFASQDLYPEYSEGYFPVTSSHSMMFDSQAANEYTFVYKHLEAVPYTVKYINARTGATIAPDKVVSDNKKVAVVEKFAPVSGYVPDRYQKSLILQINDPTQNVIVFRYTEDTEHAYYLETHYIENQDGTWRVYNSLDVLGNIGETATMSPISIEGYTFDSSNAQNVASGTISATGLELKLYYKLNTYNYKVRYLENRTNRVLASEVIDSAKVNAQVTRSAIAIENYEIVSDETVTITIVPDDTNPSRNVITFYYQLAQATYNYIPVGGGEVSLNSEIIAALTGIPAGSSPVWDDVMYRFDGWFLDEAVTIPVPAGLVNASGKITPVKETVDGKQRFVSHTYYAVFSLRGADFTIRNEMTGPMADLNETIKYEISIPDYANQTIDVVTPEGASTVTLDSTGKFLVDLENNGYIILKTILLDSPISVRVVSEGYSSSYTEGGNTYEGSSRTTYSSSGEITFINTKGEIAVTGYSVRSTYFMALALIIFGVLAKYVGTVKQNN